MAPVGAGRRRLYALGWPGAPGGRADDRGAAVAAVDVLLIVGDQDSYHEDESEILAAPKLLADILADEGLVGTFLRQARRVEILVERGRRDVLDAIGHHEVGRHGRDVHPTVPEAVEGLAARRGEPSLFGIPGAPPSYGPSWYAGALNLPLFPGPEGEGGFVGVFDDALARHTRLQTWTLKPAVAT